MKIMCSPEMIAFLGVTQDRAGPDAVAIYTAGPGDELTEGCAARICKDRWLVMAAQPNLSDERTCLLIVEKADEDS